MSENFISKKLTPVISALLLCFACAGCSVNPVTGRTQLNLFGPDISGDMSLGRKWSPQIEKEFGGVVDDVRLLNYVDYVGQSIARVSHAPGLEWHFKVLEHGSVNAFALPGGYVYLTTGMLKKLSSEAQLAAVLAHESAHVTIRHSTVRMSEQIGLDILLSVVIPEETPRGVIQAASVVRQIVELKYSREDEREADTVGLRYMVRAGYNPYGMVETMQMLEEESEFRPVEFLSTHPSPENRVEYITQLIRANYNNLGGLKTGKDDYQSAVLDHLEY